LQKSKSVLKEDACFAKTINMNLGISQIIFSMLCGFFLFIKVQNVKVSDTRGDAIYSIRLNQKTAFKNYHLDFDTGSINICFIRGNFCCIVF